MVCKCILIVLSIEEPLSHEQAVKDLTNIGLHQTVLSHGPPLTVLNHAFIFELFIDWKWNLF